MGYFQRLPWTRGAHEQHVDRDRATVVERRGGTAVGCAHPSAQPCALVGLEGYY